MICIALLYTKMLSLFHSRTHMEHKPFYRWASGILFVIEVCIAIFVPSDSFVRHSVGDFLVVILLYCLVKSFITIDAKTLAIGVLAFAFAVEFAQYFHLVDRLGIENKIMRIIIGTSFSVADLVMYSLGCLTAYVLDVIWVNKQRSEDR